MYTCTYVYLSQCGSLACTDLNKMILTLVVIHFVLFCDRFSV